MSFVGEFKENIFYINEKNFESAALELFNFQSEHCAVYNEYLSFLNVKPKNILSIYDIPCLPINFFKTKEIKSVENMPEFYFQSSGTTGIERSKHLIFDLDFYHRNALKIFEMQYGSIKNYHILALLPNYQENPHSSLISMMDYFITQSENLLSDKYNLNTVTSLLQKESDKTKLVFGVSFALLDLSEKIKSPLKNTIVVETGGMKGRRKELVREDLHNELRTKLGVDVIHSEYGMSELLSQSYAKREGKFISPPWKKILIRDINDPFSYVSSRGGINIIDLANVETCAFIETQDIGLINTDSSFEVLGRFDNSDLRGCSLMAL